MRTSNVYDNPIKIEYVLPPGCTRDICIGHTTALSVAFVIQFEGTREP